MSEETRASWIRVENLLDQALDLEPAARESFLDRACGADRVLRERLAELLRAAETPDSFLDRSVHEVAAGLVRGLEQDADASATPRPPPYERVGAYRLIREVGRGGMGAVYLGERDDDHFHREVAVKLVQPAAAPGLTARFVAERQILASLDHPGIARLYDGGTTADGTPYLVMEYIDGERLDVYCDSHRLPIAGRLALFDAVCDAVQFAHQNMVVHRDLKPTNVLVRRDGTVKLLDFGVAKLLASADGTDNGLTQTGALAMTPAYASPEQLSGGTISTATDVYALGVLLYELLAGDSPYDVTGRSPSEIERVVREQEPRRPSAAVPAEDEEARSRALARSTTPQALRRRLKGDLDNIVLTALRKEPEHRYRSVYHLRDDLLRYRTGLPVSARAPTFTYRAGKYVRRNRWGILAAAIILITLLGGLAGTAWQARAAAREARRMTEVRDFLVSLFENSDPDSTRGRSITALELLERGAARLDSGLTSQPALRADMLGVVGRIYGELGLHGRARPLLEEALQVRRRIPGSASPRDLAESAGDLANVLFEQGEYEQAERLAREALTLRRTRSADPARLAASLGDLAGVLSVRGDGEAADSLYREALEIDRRTDNPEGLAGRLSQYGTALWRMARYEESLRMHEEAVAMRRSLHGNEHTLVATSLLGLAATLEYMGDYERAEKLLRESLEIRRKLLGEAHPHVAIVLNNLGSVYQKAGRLDDAETAHRQALAKRRDALSESHPDVGTSMNNLGVVLYFKGQYAEAADIFDRVLPLWRATYGTHHPNVLSALNNLGASRRAAGDLEEAEVALRAALALRREAFGEEHVDVAQSLNNLGILLVLRGEHDEAESLFRQSTAMWRRVLGASHASVADGLVELGKLLLDRSRLAEAEPVLREVLEIRRASLDARAPLLASARLYYAENLIRLGRPDGADSLLTAALPVLRERWGESGELTRRAQRALDGLAR